MAKERVNYSEIENSCNNLTNLATSLQSTIDNLESITSQITDPTWGGAAAESYLEKIRSLCKHLPDANRQLAEAVLFLASCADGYKSIEASKLQQLKNIIGEDYINNYDVNSAPDVDLSSRVTIDNQEKDTTETQTSSDSSTTRRSSGGASSGSSGGYYGGSSGGYAASAAPAAAPAVAAAENKKDKTKEEKDKKDEKIKTLKKGEKAELADSIKQDKNKAKDYKNNKFEKDSAEEKVEKIWKDQGSTENDGIATIKVEDEERYLVKVSPHYGKVGDSIDVNLKDGSVLKCVIAETKEIKGNNANIYGTEGENGKINIIEFEATKEAKEIKFPWDENSPIKQISNNGSILESKTVKPVESKTFPIKIETTQDQPSVEIPKLDDTPQEVNTNQTNNTGNIESTVE